MSKIDDILGKVESYEYTKAELLKFKENADRSRTWTEKEKQRLLSAIEHALSTMPVENNRKTAREIVEDKGSYKIAREALDGDHLTKLEALAKELASVAGVSDMVVLKTQLRLYLHGKHFFAGLRKSGDLCWLSCREDHGVSQDTISTWEEIGMVENSRIFNSPCIGLTANTRQALAAALAAVRFI